MLTKDKARQLLEEHLKTENLIKHSLASAAVMKNFARKIGESEEEWEITGLLHDIDFDITRDDPQQHALKGAQTAKDAGLAEKYVHAIQSHNEATNIARETVVDHALAACESITGLVIACAMVYPDKKISSVKPKSIKKRMKEKAFARNVSRENIMECEKAGISFDEFVNLSLEAMSEIESELIDR